MSHLLGELVAEVAAAEVRGDPAVTVADLAYDHRAVRAGSVFFCVPGRSSDGHNFAAAAAGAGAAALVVERPLDVPLPQVLVPSVRAAMGPVSAAFFGHPARELLIIGVTGTNGKTTTTYLLEGIFRRAGLAPGIVGTTGVHMLGQFEPAPHTTPEASDVHRLLRRMVDAGVDAVAMEVSSHGLDQDRVGGVVFDCAVFTNLSRDHLDYHETLEDYFAAKAKLFTPAYAKRSVVNADSPEGRRIAATTAIPVTTFGTAADADVRAQDVESGTDGVSFRVGGTVVRSPLLGRYNVGNCLAAFAAASTVGIDPVAAADGIASVPGVPGRMERVDEGQPFTVVVDYAHTPDGIANVLQAARELAGGARVLAVLGCGGDRDRVKRPQMAQEATNLADYSVLTTDNPRSEDPAAILAEMEPGARAGGGAYTVEPDRRAAIRTAIGAARPDDVVVIAGKGHEAVQEFDGYEVPFDDRVVAAEELRALGAGAAP